MESGKSELYGRICDSWAGLCAGGAKNAKYFADDTIQTASGIYLCGLFCTGFVFCKVNRFADQKIIWNVSYVGKSYLEIE